MSAPIVYQFTEAIDKVIDQYRDQGLTFSEAIGALELVKAGIIKDGLERHGIRPTKGPVR